MYFFGLYDRITVYRPSAGREGGNERRSGIPPFAFVCAPALSVNESHIGSVGSARSGSSLAERTGRFIMNRTLLLFGVRDAAFVPHR